MEALGPILIVCAIPLILRLVPPNRMFGFRVPATLSDKTIWYEANALVGRHCLMLGLLMAGLEFVLPLSARNVVLSTVGVGGLALIMIADWRTASRWRREQKQMR